MKISVLGIILGIFILFAGISSCNRGYGCEATQSMKKSGAIDYKKGIFGKKEPRSGLFE